MDGIIKIENGSLAQETVDFIKAMEAKKKAFNEQYDAYKAELLTAMEKHGVLKFENDDVRINYIAENNSKETFDSKQFKTDMPELYDAYVKYSTVKASVRIAVK